MRSDRFEHNHLHNFKISIEVTQFWSISHCCKQAWAEGGGHWVSNSPNVALFPSFLYCIVLYCFCICIRGDGRYVYEMILSLIGKGDMDDAILSHWHCVLIHPWTGMQTYLYSIQCGVWITHAHSNCICICVRVFSPFYSTTHFDQLCYLACWERGIRSN